MTKQFHSKFYRSVILISMVPTDYIFRTMTEELNDTEWPKKMYTHFNRDYLRTLFKVELNYAGNV
jgi:hypothetical protein